MVGSYDWSVRSVGFAPMDLEEQGSGPKRGFADVVLSGQDPSTLKRRRTEGSFSPEENTRERVNKRGLQEIGVPQHEEAPSSKRQKEGTSPDGFCVQDSLQKSRRSPVLYDDPEKIYYVEGGKVLFYKIEYTGKWPVIR